MTTYNHKAKPHDYGDGAGPECLVCGVRTVGDRHFDEEPATVPEQAAPYLSRFTDPVTSHEAEAAYEPKRASAKGRVLALLRERRGHWIDAVAFTASDVGGFAGTRRLRELRDAGHPIETRRKPGSPSTWQHRLPADAPVPADALPGMNPRRH